MKKLLLFISVIGFLYACNNAESDQSDPVLIDTTAIASRVDSVEPITDRHYFWMAELDQKGGLVLKKDSPVGTDSLTAPLMIERLNSIYPDVKMELKKISGDSVFINIAKSKYLTQQMGTSGAEAYLAEVTYNLTEIKDIHFVNFYFKVGDHATPGTYTRTDFVHPRN